MLYDQGPAKIDTITGAEPGERSAAYNTAGDDCSPQAAIPPQGEIETSHLRLKDQLQKLEEQLHTLAHRLVPVRTNVDYADGEKEKDTFAFTSPVARSMYEDTAKARQLTNMVVDLLQELALP